MSKQAKIIIICVIFAVIIVILATFLTYAHLVNSFNDSVVPTWISQSVKDEFQYAAVSSDAPGCSLHGKNILLRNGSVIDAAIATLLCNGLINMHSMGLGGGFFMVYYNEKEKLSYALDARESAPAASSVKMLADIPTEERITNPLVIGVPSELQGYYAAWKRFGKLPWSELFTEAIKMATIGIPIESTLSKTIASEGPKLKNTSKLRKLMFNYKTNQFKEEGETIVRLDLANYLKKVAANPSGMKTTALHKDLADDLKDIGSIITIDDLVQYEPIWRKPLTMKLRSLLDDQHKQPLFEMHSIPPSSSGILIGLGLNIMSNYNYSGIENMKLKETVLYYHRVIETLKLIFAERSRLADESFFTEDIKNLYERLKTFKYADELQAKIFDNLTHAISYYGQVTDAPTQTGTSHVSILGQNGDAVSITSTINTRFGSTLIGERTGILFNNEIDDFSFPNVSNYFHLLPSMVNYIEPNKRPMSSMTPLIFTNVKDKKVRLVLGGSGGSLIISSVFLTAMNNLYLNMNIKDSINSPRIHHQLIPDYLLHEKILSKSILEGLRRLGHKLKNNTLLSSVQGIEISRGNFIRANADYRKGGDVAGF